MSESNSNQAAIGKSTVAALDEIFQVANRGDAPGLVVGIARHGKPLYRRGFGLASIEHGVANTAWTRMRIGSTSKHFTCLAAMLLVEEGKLDIDIGVRRYLPELPALPGEPTLRQFMTHTGGFRCYLDIGAISSAMAITPKGVGLAAQVRQRDVNFAPGDMMLYNNGGYHMLSLVIERVSGIPFERFLEERIFAPLGMVDTRSVPSDFEIHRGMATLHVPGLEGGWRRGIFPTEEIRGEGAMISTIDDMLSWLSHLRGPHTVGSDDTWSQMTTPTRLNNGTVNPYALGLMVHRYRDVDVIHHAGGVTGGTCQMITVPSHALDIIIMTNGITASPVDLAYRIIDELVGDDALGAREPRAARARFPNLLGKRYYDPASHLLVEFGAVDDKLGLGVMNGVPVALRDEDKTLRLGFEDVAMGPYVLERSVLDGQLTAPDTIEIAESGWKRQLELLPDNAPLDAAAPLAGRYRSQDLDANAVIVRENDTWKLRIFGVHGMNDLVFEPLSANVFGVTHPELAKMRLVLTADRDGDRVHEFFIHSGRTRHMRFERIDD
jgi:CubicO group peptidase (beta-lactamase class C family)